MSQHSTLSPSKAHRWANCPGSVQKCAALPATVEVRSEAADDGTHTHWLLEQFLTDPNFVPLPGETYTSKAGSFILRDDRIERLNFCIDYIRER